MDYFPEGDLFTAILTHSLYLARPLLIKSVFLQILDAVISCHDKQIYLRDLKPENVLVADEGARAYLTDFGLATSDELSTEFKTGSVYHMSPGQSGIITVFDICPSDPTHFCRMHWTRRLLS